MKLGRIVFCGFISLSFYSINMNKNRPFDILSTAESSYEHLNIMSVGGSEISETKMPDGIPSGIQIYREISKILACSSSVKLTVRLPSVNVKSVASVLGYATLAFFTENSWKGMVTLLSPRRFHTAR